MVKRIFVAIIFVVLAAFAGVQGFAEGEPSGYADDMEGSPSEAVEAEGADGERSFNEFMEALYESWLENDGLEGDNAFERAVELAWRNKGDIGGISAAIAAMILVLVIIFRYVPLARRYVNFTGAAALQTKREVIEALKSELGRYSSALEAAEQVSELYPEFAALVEKTISRSEELKALVTDIGGRLESTEKRHASALRLQGETFKDMISLSALPASKKFEILENYRVIELEGEADAHADGGEGDAE